jgi:hypothetical protein
MSGDIMAKIIADNAVNAERDREAFKRARPRIARLERMKLNDLIDHFADLFGHMPPRHDRRDIIKRCALKLQRIAREELYGGG